MELQPTRLNAVATANDPLQVWREEIDRYFERLRDLPELQPEEIFVELAGISARMSEIRHFLMRMQTRAAQALRTTEVDPLLDELDRQYKCLSRHQTVREYEYNLSRGA